MTPLPIPTADPTSPATNLNDGPSLASVADATGEETPADEPPRLTRTSVRSLQKEKRAVLASPPPAELRSEMPPATTAAKKKGRLVFLEPPVKKKKSVTVRTSRVTAPETQPAPFNVSSFLAAFSGGCAPPAARFGRHGPL